MTATVWQTAEMPAFEPSDQLKAAVEHYKAEKKRAAKIEHAALEKLYDAMAAEMIAKPNVSNTAIGAYLGYTGSHVRRIGRERGVPAKVDVEPPKRRFPSRIKQPDHLTPPESE